MRRSILTAPGTIKDSKSTPFESITYLKFNPFKSYSPPFPLPFHSLSAQKISVQNDTILYHKIYAFARVFSASFVSFACQFFHIICVNFPASFVPSILSRHLCQFSSIICAKYSFAPFVSIFQHHLCQVFFRAICANFPALFVPSILSHPFFLSFSASLFSQPGVPGKKRN